MGETSQRETPMIRFRRGLPGFPGDRSFCLLRWGSAGGIYSVLVDPADPSVRFLVVPPGLFFPTYEVELDDATVAQLEITSADEVLLLVIVTVSERPEDATANLLGPIVINTVRREGLQLVMSEPRWDTRVPLLAEAMPARDSQDSENKEPARCSS
ncbi:MAG TPA: flagellar assembly protein FliW [Mycobacteriales bacterium]|nr:flagellar assembly protein FliW [Mycobacteriales bacterium]